MPKEDYIAAKRDSRTKLTETSMTPQELGAYLRNKYDLVILGENHLSQKLLDTNGIIFDALDASRLHVESSPSDQRQIDKRDKESFLNNWGNRDTAMAIAMQQNIPIKAVDIEHCKSAISVKSFTRIARKVEGEEGALVTAIRFAKDECRLNGGDPSTLFKGPSKPLKIALEEFFAVNGNKISDFNRENVWDALGQYQRDKNAGPMEKFISSLKLREWGTSGDNIHERNTEMAESILTSFPGQPEVRQVEALTVGLGHNDEIERLLEQKGLEVCNVKTFNTKERNLDGKVYRNEHPSKNDGAEWVVAVYDEKNTKTYLFEDKYVAAREFSPRNLPLISDGGLGKK